MRVTSSMMVRTTLRDLSQGLQRLQHTQARLSSGKQLTAASDDPTAATEALGLRQQVRRNEQYVRTIRDAEGWLQTADATLTAGLERLTRVSEIAVRAGNSGGLSDPGARTAMAIEVRAIRDDMLALANTSYGDRSIFAGTDAGAAYDASGAFVGDTGAVRRDVAPNTTLDVNLPGTSVFGAQGGPVGDLFAVLDRMATAIQAGDGAALATEHTNVDAAVDAMSAATVELGSRAARLEEIKVRAEDDAGRLRALLTQVEDVDVVEALITAKSQEKSYEASLMVAAKILPPSLLDFLR
jgi:flagellar hook-associated protein 3 FlgL